MTLILSLVHTYDMSLCLLKSHSALDDLDTLLPGYGDSLFLILLKMLSMVWFGFVFITTTDL
jgi:hypothetical protein